MVILLDRFSAREEQASEELEKLRSRIADLEEAQVQSKLDNTILQHQLDNQSEQSQLQDLFVSIVSHELRTPLTVVNGYIYSLQRQLTQQTNAIKMESPEYKEKQLRSLSVIQQQTSRMTEMITQLLDFSRIQNHQLELVYASNMDLVELVRHMVEQFEQTTATHRLQLQLDKPVLIGDFDIVRIEQVLSNLISNAIKYSPAGTTVTIYLGQNATGEALIKVRDEGFGIQPQYQDQIFDRFYRERTNQNRRVDGLGLGLFISREIVVQHGGRIWVESQLGTGSTFYFTLPLT